MSRNGRDIEDFLRNKLDQLDQTFQDDWAVFERKLARALFFKRLRLTAVFSAVALLLSIGFYEFSDARVSYSDDYQPRDFFSDEVEKEDVAAQSVAYQMPIAPNVSQNTSLKIIKPIVKEEAEVSKNADSFLRENRQDFNPVGSTQEKAASDGIILKKEKDVAVADLNAAQSESAGSSQDDFSNRGSDQNTVAENQNGETDLYENKGAETTARDADNQNGIPTTGKAANSKIAINEKAELAANALVLKVPDLSKNLMLTQAEPLAVRPPSLLFKTSSIRRQAYVSPLQEANPWSYSINVYPNFTFRKFKVDGEKMGYIHRDFIDQTEASESGGFCLNVGLEASRRVGRVTYLNGGVEYISYKTKAAFDFNHFREAVIDEGSGKIAHYTLLGETQRVTLSDNNVYHYLNLPLSISHQPWVTDHIQLNVEAGGSYLYFLKASGRSLDYQTLEIINLEDRQFRRSIGSFFMKVGATYYVSPKLNFGLEPTLLYFTNTIYTEEYPFRVIPYSVGVNLKLQVKLN